MNRPECTGNASQLLRAVGRIRFSLFFGLINEHKKGYGGRGGERWDARDTCAKVKKNEKQGDKERHRHNAAAPIETRTGI
jgi:hypothetical protein